MIKWDDFGAETAVGFVRFGVNAGIQSKEAQIIEDHEQQVEAKRRASEE